MNTLEEPEEVDHSRMDLLAYHQAVVTPTMEACLKLILPTLCQRALHGDMGITLIDLQKSKFPFSCSVHKHQLADTIHLQTEDNWEEPYYLIHSDDRSFYCESDSMGYKYLMDCTPDEREQFEMIYILRLKNRDGSFSVYLFRTYQLLSDETGIPWILCTETTHLAMCKVENFQPYRQFCLISKERAEVIKRFDAANKKEFSELQLERIQHVGKIKGSEVAKKVFRSKQTVRNSNIDIFKRLNVSTSSDAKLLAKWLKIT